MARGKGGAPLGNKNGIKNRPWREALEKEVKQALVTKNRDLLRELAKTTLDMAIAGDPQARKEVADRLDGKPQQSVELSFSEAIAEQLREARARTRGD